jgi:hypothetical protein
MEDWIQLVPGAQQLFDWFGYWPSFHDAEVLSIELNRTGVSKVRVHTFQSTSEVDSKGFYVCDKHCIVTFVVDDITEVELTQFNHQNVLSDLEFGLDSDEFVMKFSASYGLEGTVRAKKVTIGMTAGIPPDSQYKKTEL